jgi:predicted small lipoprotein YifL
MRVVCLLMLALLAGCGQKGPLYFAPEEPTTAAPPSERNPLIGAADTRHQDRHDHGDADQP